MKKICLFIVGIYIGVFSLYSQTVDSGNYKKRRLKVEEMNLISSYYSQDGNNSAVTGGIGTEKLKDYSAAFELKLFRYDRQKRKRSLEINLGADYYTSASSDKINPNTISSASSEDIRIYPSAEYAIENVEKRKKISFNLSASAESDYVSAGIGAGITHSSRNNNREFTAKLKLYADQVKIILPYELRTRETGGLDGAPNEYDYPWEPRMTYSAFFSLSQVVNQRLQIIFLLDPAYQHGFLSMPFHRVYFSDYSLQTELLPSSRLKIPAGIRANYSAGDHIILRSFYRFYKDDWGLMAHTADIETVFRLSPFFSLSPFYRYHTQTGIRYFKPYMQHLSSEKYYSSNYDLSEFKSNFFGSGFRFTPINKIMGFSQAELRYGYYARTNKLHSNVISLLLNIQ